MFGYYTVIILLSWAALLTMGILVYENNRILPADKRTLYLTYLLVFLASAAEWVGLRINGLPFVPTWILRAVKFLDYTLTPMCGAIFVFHMHLNNLVQKILYSMILLNICVQMVTIPTNLMLVIDKDHQYHHGPLFNFYIALCLCVIVTLIIEFIIFGNTFRKKNRKSLYAIMLIVVSGLVIQETFSNIRIAYLGMSIGCALMFIHYSEFTQLKTDDILTEQKIRLMLSQIKPHFLYNSLGSIEALCDLDPKSAKQATRLFARYLRGNMEAITADTLIPFEQELQHTKLYLELEKIRFEDALEVNFKIDAVDFMIPPLTLEPIVENAVKHGIRKKPDGRGRVMIKTSEYADKYCVSVIDDGVGFDSREKKDDGRSHVGVTNVRTRLKQICNASLEIVSIPGAGTIATIEIPKDKAKD